MAIESLITALKDAPSSELHKQYAEVFPDEEIASFQKSFLQRKIAYKLQERELGGLSSEAKNRLKRLIEEYDPINNKALRPANPVVSLQVPAKDKRLPIPGTEIIKEYKGSKYKVKVLEKGFEYNEKIYKTLSAVAKEISGAHWNGYLFFNL